MAGPSSSSSQSPSVAGPSGSSGAKMVAGGKRPRKQRQAISCTECRQRKLKCDRKVPGCSACIKRKLPPGRCRFGDERDLETPQQREERLRKANAASAKRARKRKAAAAARLAAAKENGGEGPSTAGGAGRGTSHEAERSRSVISAGDGSDSEDQSSGDSDSEEDEEDELDPDDAELSNLSGAKSAKRPRTGSTSSSTPSDPSDAMANPLQVHHPSLNGDRGAIASPPKQPDLQSLRQAAAAVAAAVGNPSSGASTPGITIPSAAQHSALASQARSNAFAAHAQAQAQHMADASQKHGIAALVAAISHGNPAAAVAAFAAGQLPSSALSAMSAAVSTSVSAGGSMRVTMAPDVSLTAAPVFSNTPRPHGAIATSQPTVTTGKNAHTETDDLLDTLSATDTTNAALGLQRLYETVETLGMLKRNSVDSSSRNRADDKDDSKDSERAEPPGTEGEVLSAASLEALGKHLGPLAGLKMEATGRSMSGPAATLARSASAGVAGSPFRAGGRSSLAAIGAELMRRDSLFEMSNKSRALALLPGKQQTIHLMQMYLDELGVVIPFVRPDFVMKELDLLYDSLDHKTKPATTNSSNSWAGTPLLGKVKEEPQQSAATVVNPVVGTGPGAGLPHPRLTFLAYVFFALGSIAELLPSSYLISYNIVRSSEQVAHTLHDWQEAAIGCIDAAELAANPSLEGVQAALVAVIALAHRFRHKDLLRLLDSATRAARRLGLDRLGSADPSAAAGPRPDLTVEPSKRTLQHWWIDPEVEMSAANLEIGRAVWSGILIADWNHCGLNGSYNIHPHSYSTRPPIAPASPEFCKVGIPSPHDAWLGLLEASEIARRWLDLTKTHEMMGTSVDYSAMLALDDELAAILTRRSWTDKDEDLTFSQPQLAESEEIKRLRRQASLIRSSVYHRTLKLHRPFMARGYRNPEKYGASVRRSLESANALVEEAKTMSKRGWLSSRDRIQKYYLFQACLAMITDLWYRPRPLYEDKGDSESGTMRESLSFIIDRLKDEGQSTEGSVLHGASANLERLLSATVQRSLQPGGGPAATTSSTAGVATEASTSSRNAAATEGLSSTMAPAYLPPESPFGTGSINGDGSVIDLLDAQLLRLAEMAPTGSLMNLGALDGYGGSSNDSDSASFAPGISNRMEPGGADMNGLMNQGPDWDQAWTDLFETLEGDGLEASA